MRLKLDKAYLFIGEIASGKSTLAKRFSEEFHVPHVSFGKYLLSYCEENGLLDDVNEEGEKRKVLQDTGQQLVEKNPEEFINNVVTHQAKGASVVIFDGVRHKVIWDAISKASDSIIGFFIDVPDLVRYERYRTRIKDIDNNKDETFESFMSKGEHEAESEIQFLKDRSYVIQGNDTISNILDLLKGRI